MGGWCRCARAIEHGAPTERQRRCDAGNYKTRRRCTVFPYSEGRECRFRCFSSIWRAAKCLRISWKGRPLFSALLRSKLSMKLLKDECIDERLPLLFPTHDCQTVRFANLASAAEDAGFDVLVTVDQTPLRGTVVNVVNPRRVINLRAACLPSRRRPTSLPHKRQCCEN